MTFPGVGTEPEGDSLKANRTEWFMAGSFQFSFLDQQLCARHFGATLCLDLDRCVCSLPRSSSREVTIRVPFLFSVVYFCRGTLPQKGNGQRALLKNLASYPPDSGGGELSQVRPSHRHCTSSPPSQKRPRAQGPFSSFLRPQV